MPFLFDVTHLRGDTLPPSAPRQTTNHVDSPLLISSRTILGDQDRLVSMYTDPFRSSVTPSLPKPAHPAETIALFPVARMASDIVSKIQLRGPLTMNLPVTISGFSTGTEPNLSLSLIHAWNTSTYPMYTGGFPDFRNSARSSGGVYDPASWKK